MRAEGEIDPLDRERPQRTSSVVSVWALITRLKGILFRAVKSIARLADDLSLMVRRALACERKLWHKLTQGFLSECRLSHRPIVGHGETGLSGHPITAHDVN
jgi:hypothetical protein